MDCGCYAINVLRYAMGSEPIECIKSTVTPSHRTCGLTDESQKKEVDGTTIAEYSFATTTNSSEGSNENTKPVIGTIECSLVGSIFGSLIPTITVFFFSFLIFSFEVSIFSNF